MKTSDYITEYLSKQGVTHVFEVVGGMISHLIDSMNVKKSPVLVSMHHEQAAAFAAEAMGRISGIPGVAMATSGPGAINLLTGIGSAYFDSAPSLFITGQVNRNEKKGSLPIRQLGFQEADIVSMAKPITKAAWSIDETEDVVSTLPLAFALAQAGRPGPVLLDIPMDIQRANISVDERSFEQKQLPIETSIDKTILSEMLESLQKAKRPLILVGGGIRAARATHLFRELVNSLSVPVVCSLLGVDALSSESAHRIGLIGTYGNRWANLALGECDVLIVIGSRLDVRQTGADTNFFKGNRTIFHLDCEPGEVNNRVKGCIPVMGHLIPLLENLLPLSKSFSCPSNHSWFKQIEEWKIKYPDTSELQEIKGINPNAFMHHLSKLSATAGAYVVDVGQHQMWAAQSLRLTNKQRFLTSGGMGAMGFSLPASIGASFALPNQPIVVIAGDGSFQLNIQELQTIVRNQLPIKIVVLNNRCHGMVRQFQESYFDGRFQSTMWGYSAPDFTMVAKSYGIDACTATSESEMHDALDNMWSQPTKPYLLQLMIDSFANAYPKIAFGHPLTEMEPFAKPLAMEAT